MKFPKKLSKERLSLLSPEDRKIYEYEHSGLCPEMKKLYESEEVDDEELTFEEVRDFELDNEYTEEEKREIKRIFDEMLFESLFDELYDKELIEEVGLDEYNDIKKQIFEYIMNDPELNALNEAEGRAADWWMDCSWIIKLSAGLLTGLLGIIAWLLMKGKDRLAMAKLKQYMNKLVELTDQGINKKRPWYSFLMPSRKNKQNTGDYNRSCFRTIQETYERNMACLYARAVHSLGYMDPNASNFRGLNRLPQEGSGLNAFNNLALGLTGDIDNYYGALLPVLPDPELFKNIGLPKVPTNFTMLMSNIDYPAKARENPNGSLFMKPTEEILQAAGEDLGLTYFSKATTDSILNIKSVSQSTEESFLSTRNSALMSLLEIADENGIDKTKDFSGRGLLTGDIDPTDVFGAETEQETEKRQRTEIEPFDGNIIHAIDSYVRESLTDVIELCRIVCGESVSNDLKELSKTIMTLLNASEGNIAKFMRKHDDVLHDIMDDARTLEINKQNAKIEAMNTIVIVGNAIDVIKSTNPSIFQSKKLKAWRDASNELKDFHDLTKKDVELRVLSIFNMSISLLQTLANKQHDKSTGKGESLIYDTYYKHVMNENEQIRENAEEIIKSFRDHMKVSYDETLNKISTQMATILNSYEPSKWLIVTEAKLRMEDLKKRADDEITKKIELICRTASSANSDLGDKFKSALSKHPVRAESLKNIWAKYSDDLTDRILSRLKSIYGGNANSSMVPTIRKFLTNTYPNLIALMIYYKGIFYLTKEYTSKYPVSKEKGKLEKLQLVREDNAYLLILLYNLDLELNNTQQN